MIRVVLINKDPSVFVLSGLFFFIEKSYQNPQGRVFVFEKACEFAGSSMLFCVLLG